MQGRDMFIGGSTVNPRDVAHIYVNYTDEPSEHYRAQAEAERMESNVFPGSPVAWYMAGKGKVVTDDFITGPAGSQLTSPAGLKTEQREDPQLTREVFIVHGHNKEMEQAVARTLTSLGLVPVILHEQANQGQTIIEKFIAHANVSFAVVLLSGDDIAYPRKSDAGHARPRARQNVVLELGFFIGKLGRNSVMVLYSPEQGFELPSDIAGLLYTKFDKEEAWRYRLANELKTRGYDIDLNKLA